MDFVMNFFTTFGGYIQELWWSVLLGFLISGLFFEFVPQNIIDKYLNRDGLKPILIASFIGTILPVCCFGSLPIAVTMRNKGAKLGPILAFLVATPATSISALAVCLRLFGGLFTIYIFCIVILMGLIMGIIGNLFKVPSKVVEEESCPHCCEEDHEHHSHETKTFAQKIKGAIQYAFITLPKEIGLELLLGVAIASILVVAEPIQNIIRQYLAGAWGFLFMLVVGLTTYVCSTASVPMADAFIKSGMTFGQGMTYLLVGPITSLGALLILKKEFGPKILATYLVLISIFSLLFGVGFDIIR